MYRLTMYRIYRPSFKCFDIKPLNEKTFSYQLKPVVFVNFLSLENSPRLLYPIIKHADISHSRHGLKKRKDDTTKDQTI